MLEYAIRSFEFSQKMAGMMVADVPDEKWAEQPRPKMNHAAWVIGHLALTADFIGSDLGADRVAPEGWMELCGFGSTPVSDRGKYPSREELLAGLEVSGRAVRRIVEAMSQEQAAEPMSEQFVKMGLPTRGDLVAGIITAHHGFHVGQLSAWRRAMGYPPVFKDAGAS